MKEIITTLMKKYEPVLTAIETENSFYMNDMLITAAEAQSNKIDINKSFYRLLTENVNSIIKNINISEILPKINKRRIYFLIPFIIILMLYFLTTGDKFKLRITRYINPFTKTQITLIPFEVIPGNISLLLGTDIEIKVKARSEIKKVNLVYKTDNGSELEENLSLQNSISNSYIYSTKINNVSENMSYYIKTVQGRKNYLSTSPEYRITVLPKPLIEEITLKYYSPKYLNLPVKEEKGGNIEAIEGTTVKITAIANNPVIRARLLLNNKNINNMMINKNRMTASITIKTNSNYIIKFKDINNNINNDPVEYSITALKDYKPKIEIKFPGRDIDLPENMLIPLKLIARDDYRVESIELGYKLFHSYIYTFTNTIYISIPVNPDRIIEAEYKWQISSIEINPGDQIHYFARCRDGAFPPEKRWSYSKRYIIKFPSISDIYKKMNKDDEEQLVDLKDLLKNQKSIKSETEKLLNDILKNNKITYVEKKKYEELAEKQNKMMAKSQKLTEKLRSSINKLKKNKLASPDLMEKMNKVRDLVQETLTPEMKEVMEKLQSLSKSIKLDDAKRKLLAAKYDSEKISAQLDKTIKMLEKLQLKRKFEGLMKQADNILEKQNELFKDTMQNKDKNADQLSKRQSELQNDLEEMKKGMKELSKDAQNKNESELSDSLNKMQEHLDNANTQQKMQQSSESLKNKKFSDSLSKQNSILQDLNNMKNSMNMCSSSMCSQNSQEIIEEIKEASYKMLEYSTKQESINKNTLNFHQMHNISQDKSMIERYNNDNDLEDNERIDFLTLAEDEIYVKRGILNVKKKLYEKTKDSVDIPFSLFDKFDAAAGLIETSRKSLETSRNERNKFSAITAIKTEKQAIAKINNIISELLKIKNNMNQNQQGSGMGNFFDMLNQLANSQKNLNDLVNDLKGKIGQGMTPEMQEYLEELAFQQQMIKDTLGSMLQNTDGIEKLLGDLSQTAKEMEEIKKKIQENQLDAELEKKQKRVLKHLMDSQKSFQIKEYSKERQAEKPGDIGDHNLNIELSEEMQKLKKEKLHFKSDIENYPEEFKKLVEKYFKSLNIIESQ